MEKSGRHRNLKSPKSLGFPSVIIPKVVSANPPGQAQKLIAGCLMETTLIKQYVVKWEKKPKHCTAARESCVTLRILLAELRS